MKFVILACYPEEIHYSCTKESSQNVVLPNRSQDLLSSNISKKEKQVTLIFGIRVVKARNNFSLMTNFCDHLFVDMLKMTFRGYVSNVSENLISCLIFTQKKSSQGALLYFANVILGKVLLTVKLKDYSRQNIQEWIQQNLWKTAFKKFEVIWSAQTDHIQIF